MYKICFYVPETHLLDVKQAIFAAGAGKVGQYDCCAWQTRGTGQFRPLADSQPFLGTKGEISTVIEYKVELVCHNNNLRPVIAALKAAHPYEEPAYDVWPLSDI